VCVCIRQKETCVYEGEVQVNVVLLVLAEAPTKSRAADVSETLPPL
jgi:hypothetical protein